MFKYILTATLAAISFLVFFFDAGLSNESVGKLFVSGILGCLLVFLIFKTGLHYKINALNRFSLAFYYSVFEYKKAQKNPSGLSYANSVRVQGDVALTVNFDPTLSTAHLKIPASLYSGKDPFLDKLRAKIKEAETIKLKARQLDGKATVMLEKTKDLLVEKDLAGKTPSAPLVEAFDIEDGVAHIVDVTVDEIKDQGYGDTPDYEFITRIAFDNSPYFSTPELRWRLSVRWLVCRFHCLWITSTRCFQIKIDTNSRLISIRKAWKSCLFTKKNSIASDGTEEKIQYGNPRWKHNTNNGIDKIVFC